MASGVPPPKRTVERPADSWRSPGPRRGGRSRELQGTVGGDRGCGPREPPPEWVISWVRRKQVSIECPWIVRDGVEEEGDRATAPLGPTGRYLVIITPRYAAIIYFTHKKNPEKTNQLIAFRLFGPRSHDPLFCGPHAYHGGENMGLVSFFLIRLQHSGKDFGS